MQANEGPAAKKLKGQDGVAKAKEANAERTIHQLHKFHLTRDCHFAGEVKTNKTGRRFAPLQTSATDKSRLLLQLSGGGGIPPFGIKTDNEYEDASTSLIFNVDNESEVDALRRWNTAAVQLAVANKHIWWPKGITNDQIKDNFASVFTDKKPKTNGDGFWSPQMKVRIPIDTATGNLKSCHIINTESCDICFTDLPSTTWDTLVLEITGVYFTGKYTWGLAKQLFKLKTASKSSKKTERDPRLVQFVQSDLFLSKPQPELKPKNEVVNTPEEKMKDDDEVESKLPSLVSSDSIDVPGYLDTVTCLDTKTVALPSAESESGIIG